VKRLLLSIVLLGGPSMALAAYDSAAQRFPSPSGKFEVGFRAQDQALYPTPNMRALPAGKKSRLYSISFYAAGANTPIATTYFTDIQGDNQSEFPTPLAKLAKGILWSPQDSFAVLPQEAWPAQGNTTTAHRQAVSLDLSSSWQVVDFPFQGEPLAWIGTTEVAGNLIDGCRLDVAKFDAKTGKTSFIQQASPPDGYVVQSAVDGVLLLRKVLGDCATDAQRAAFRPECIRYDLRFERREIGACPS
jgi:hypothetical protein